MDVDRLSVYDCSASHPETADGSSLTEPDATYWDRPVMSDPPEDVTINAVDDSIGCLAKPCGSFCYGIQDRLNVGRRAGDHTQDFARSGLLFLSLLNFPRLSVDGLFQLRERVFGRRGMPSQKGSRSALSVWLLRAFFGSGFHKIDARSPDQIAQAKISIISAERY